MPGKALLTAEQTHVLAGYVLNLSKAQRGAPAHSAPPHRRFEGIRRPHRPAQDKGVDEDAAQAVVSLYQKQKRSMPARCRAVRDLGWALVFVTQIVFYGLPWLQFNDRRPPCSTWRRDASTSSAGAVPAGPIPDGLLIPRRTRCSCLPRSPAAVVRLRLPATVYTEIFMGSSTGCRATGCSASTRRRSVRLNKLLRRRDPHVWIAIGLWTASLCRLLHADPELVVSATQLGSGRGSGSGSCSTVWRLTQRR